MLRLVLKSSIGLLALALAAELLLRLLPVSTATMTGYYKDPDLLTYPPRHRFTVATGWDLRNVQHLQANNWGFVAERDFVPDPQAVALIGDSYVEASMLDLPQRPAAQLEAQLGGRAVYAMGSPGTALLDYAQVMRFAVERFQVRDVVLLLEAYDARQALCGSGNVHSRCLDPRDLSPSLERRAAPDGLKMLARHSALAQYLVSQLKLSATGLWRTTVTRNTPEATAVGLPGRRHEAPTPQAVARSKAVVDAMVAEFIRVVTPFRSGRLVVVVDGNRHGPPATPALVDLERRHLIERLREAGATVVDLELRFAEHEARSQRSLNVGPQDGHLNPLGVQIAMAAAAGALGRR